jgi:isoamylase
MTTRSGPLLVAAALAGAALLTACPSEKLPRLYARFDSPPSGLVTDSTPALWDTTVPGEKVALTEDLISGQQVLGAQLVKDLAGKFRGVNFSVYSQRADKVRLELFDDPESPRATREFEMARFGDVWNVYVEGVGLGQHYGYLAWGPNWAFDESWFPGSIRGYHADVDVAGNRFNPNKMLFDPYCKVFHRGHDWAKGSAGTGPDRIQSTFAAAMKCRVVQSGYVWSDEEIDWREGRRNDSRAGHHWNDLVIYEAHAKGFTANSSSGVPHYGTYRGFAEKADYLSDLGVNAVELMPPFDKADDAGYWGYNTLGYFAPEHSYMTLNRMAEGIDEFKFMVDELHKRDIEVILDVVYNHTGEGGLWRQKIYVTDQSQPYNLDPQNIASLFGFRGLDNATYYALPPGDGTQYCDYTGVGNTMRDNAPPMRRLIIDSLRYWVEEMHVDGFRFDLAPALGAKDGKYDNCPTSANHNGGGITWDVKSTMVQAVIDDPVLKKYNARVIAEPWGGGYYALTQSPAASDGKGYAWAEWNGRFRDWWRSFVNNNTRRCETKDGSGNCTFWSGVDLWNFNHSQDGVDGGKALTGSDFMFQPGGRKPYHSINFVTCHDGMTMYDILSYNAKVNGCSPLNPRCCNDPLSSFCQEAQNSGTDDNRSFNWTEGSPTCNASGGCGWGTFCYGSQCVESEGLKRMLMRDLFLGMMISHGTPMVFGGDEWMRTQLGNNNTYTPEADNAYSWHDWGAWQGVDERQRMRDFVKQAIRFRKDHASLLAPADYGTFQDAFWRNADNTQKTGTGWDARTVMIHYSAKAPELLILVNMDDGDVSFTLPTGRTWKRLIDTQAYFDTLGYLNDQKLSTKASANATLDNPETMVNPTYGVKSRSIVVMEAR